MCGHGQVGTAIYAYMWWGLCEYFMYSFVASVGYFYLNLIAVICGLYLNCNS